MRKLADIFQSGDPTLLKELSEGFQLLGNLNPGWGWPKRTDERYSQPITKEQLLTDNLYCTQQKLAQHRCDQHWKTLLQEIATDVQTRRMDGPFKGLQYDNTQSQPPSTDTPKASSQVRMNIP
jgi:hypothetical protein